MTEAIPLMGHYSIVFQFFDIVNKTIEFPLSLHFCFSLQAEPIHSFVASMLANTGYTIGIRRL